MFLFTLHGWLFPTGGSLSGLLACGAYSGSVSGVTFKATRLDNRGQVSRFWCNAGRSHVFMVSFLHSSIKTTELVSVKTQNISDFA